MEGATRPKEGSTNRERKSPVPRRAMDMSLRRESWQEEGQLCNQLVQRRRLSRALGALLPRTLSAILWSQTRCTTLVSFPLTPSRLTPRYHVFPYLFMTVLFRNLRRWGYGTFNPPSLSMAFPNCPY